MKKAILSFFIILLYSASVYAFPPVVSISGSSIVFWETFDGGVACGDGSHTNCLNTWSVSGSVIDFNVAGIQGTNAANLDSNGTVAYIEVQGAWADLDTVYLKAIIKFTTLAPSANRWFLGILNGSTVLATIQVVNSGADQIFRIAHGTVTQSGSTDLATATTYYIWFQYTKGSGANGVANLWFNTSDSFPGVGSTEAAIANGDQTSQADGLRWRTEPNQEVDFTVDTHSVAQVLVK